jgi:hypothetical protein
MDYNGALNSSIDIFVQLESEGYSREEIQKLFAARRRMNRFTRKCLVSGFTISALCLAFTILVIGIPISM